MTSYRWWHRFNSPRAITAAYLISYAIALAVLAWVVPTGPLP